MLILMQIFFLIIAVITLFLSIIIFLFRFFCVFHVFKYGKKKSWLPLLLFVPLGWFFYVLFEIDKRGNPAAKIRWIIIVFLISVSGWGLLASSGMITDYAAAKINIKHQNEIEKAVIEDELDEDEIAELNKEYNDKLLDFKFKLQLALRIIFLLIAHTGWVLYILIRKPNLNDYWEIVFKGTVMFAALCAIVFLLGIIASLVVQGFKIFIDYGFLKFIFGTQWYPTEEPAEFGILPIILGSLLVTFITVLISVPMGVCSAIYISEIAKPMEKEFLKPFIELLAGIPSVIFGLFGMLLLSNWVRIAFGLKTGFNAFTASIILGIMVIPIISSISEDAINSVPKNLREASLALGANKWETIIKVVIPAARSGIFTAVILGMGRAIGETMVVLMVAGNSAVIPKMFFDSVRPMTSTIASEMGETPFWSEHYFALFGIGIILFAMTFGLNILTGIVRDGIKKRNFSK